MSQSIIDRCIGVLKLDHPTYEDIEHDQSALTQAAVVVAVAGLAAGIGSIDDGVLSIIVVPIASIVGWVVASALIYFVGTRLIPSPSTEADIGQVLRLWGFASVPGVASIIAFVPLLGPLVGFVAAIWGIVIGVYAIMHALEMSGLRAIATAILASLAAAIVIMFFGLIFGVGSLAFT